MRAVFGETRGGRGSGIGRSFNDDGFRVIDLLFNEDDLEARSEPFDLLEPDLLVARDEVLFDAGLIFAWAVIFDLEWPLVRELDLACGFVLVAPACRRSRRWTLLIAATSSSFFIACHPGTPWFLAISANSRRVCAFNSAVLITLIFSRRHRHRSRSRFDDHRTNQFCFMSSMAISRDPNGSNRQIAPIKSLRPSVKVKTAPVGSAIPD